MTKRVFAILLTPEWVEIRVGSKPPKMKTSSFTLTVDVLQNNIVPDPLGRLDRYGHVRQVYVTQKVKVPKVFKQVTFIGGEVLGQLCVNEYNKNALKHVFPYVSIYERLVELPEKWAENFLNPDWRSRSLKKFIPAEGDI